MSPLLLPAGAGRGFWPRQRAFDAKCHAGEERPKGHRPPTRGCSCGIYASDSLGSFMRSGRPRYASVIGQVAMWGKVIEHEHGWRSRYAYPARLRLICAVCLALGSGDGAPSAVRLAAPGALVATCWQHRNDIPHVQSADADVLQALLLSVYAVDLLPAESLRPFFAPPQQTRLALGWPETDVRPSAPVALPPRAAQPVSTVPSASVPGGTSTSPSTDPLEPVPTSMGRATWASGPTSSAAAPTEPLALRALKAVGIGIAWLLQAAFFLLFLFVGCADAFYVTSLQP